MWNPEVDVPSETIAAGTYVLSKSILATEQILGRTSELRLGPLLTLPEGAEIECCGKGFNEQTLKVRWRGKFYFVFREELEERHEGLAMSAGGRF